MICHFCGNVMLKDVHPVHGPVWFCGNPLCPAKKVKTVKFKQGDDTFVVDLNSSDKRGKRNR